MATLNVESLQVVSFETSSEPTTSTVYSAPLGPGGYCCTGCDSGCGINPTALGCESEGGESAVLAPAVE